MTKGNSLICRRLSLSNNFTVFEPATLTGMGPGAAVSGGGGMKKAGPVRARGGAPGMSSRRGRAAQVIAKAGRRQRPSPSRNLYMSF